MKQFFSRVLTLGGGGKFGINQAHLSSSHITLICKKINSLSSFRHSSMFLTIREADTFSMHLLGSTLSCFVVLNCKRL